MGRLRIRRWLAPIAALVVVVAIVVGRPTYHWVRAWLHDRPTVDQLPPNHVDDASRQNATRVAKVWPIPPAPPQAEDQLRALLARARMEQLPVAIAGARHTMGGHTIAPEGIVVDMLPFRRMTLDAPRRLLTVGAGARWSQVVPYLDERGMSVGVMQSNNDFSVGGSISVNCHGWQHDQPPIASTVESLRLMKADGEVVRCSRKENAELFSLVLGGYGLFGVILDVELRVVPNECYQPEVELVPASEYATRLNEKFAEADPIGMAYGRLCVVPGDDTFLREAILTAFRRVPCPVDEIPPMRSAADATLRREVYRGQIDSDSGKEVRWKLEKTFGEQISRQRVSRNQLLNESAAVYQERNADRADILHEYFVPPAQVPAFLDRAREIIPAHDGDLMNVTIRTVRRDRDSFLRYATEDLFAFVMLFNQPRTRDADRNMQAMTQALIDAALDSGGRYYLPYRLHATPAQLQRAYPQSPEFFKLKRRYDPDEVFQNQFYTTYGKP